MICENCGKEHDGKYGSGRFCSVKCARSYSTKNNKGQLKEARCINCNKLIYISKNFSNKKCLCDNCKENIHKEKICKICGQKYNTNKCQNTFCQQHNIQHFKSLIKYFGFNKEKLGTSDVEKEFNRIRNILYDLYWNKNLSSTEIAKKFNYKSTPTNIIQKFFKKYLNIPVKSCEYAVKENYFEGRENIRQIHNQYKQQWHTTWNNKRVFLRSSYELNYANELDMKQIDYEVENLHIKYWDSQNKEYRCAIPDFYIPKDNMIVEIKSSYTLDKQNMIDKMKAYLDLGYSFKLICDNKELNIQ